MRTYRAYDHRLKRAIALAGDPNLFPELGIPRSTALGWIRRGAPDVVTTDALDLDHDSLIVENQKLRNELAKTKTTQRLQSFTFKLFGLQIQYRRLPRSDSKAMLLRAVQAATQTIGLSAKERSTLGRYARDPKLGHLSTSALSWLAKRRGALFASTTTWCRLVREQKLRPTMRRLYPPRPKKGIRAKLPGEILHIDVTILRLIDGSRAFIQAVIDNASRCILAHCVSADYSGLRSRQLLLEALGKVRRAIVPNVYCDSGSENLNGEVDALVTSEQMTRTVAQIDVVIPHSAHRGATPAEVFFGKWSQREQALLDQCSVRARLDRLSRYGSTRSLD